YIKTHPNAGQIEIQKNTKIKIQYLFNNIKEAYKLANIKYPREENLILRNRDNKERIQEIFTLVKKYPETTAQDIINKLHINPFKLFKSLEELYKLAKIFPISGAHKRTLKKQKIIIEYIKNNPLATQREINKNCKTKVQEIFDRGIFGAYKGAKIGFPFERLKFHGSALKEVKQRARDFEDEIARRLTCYGNVQRLVKTQRGIADIILERNNKKIIIEIKDYLNKEISKHEIKQLNKYLEDCNINLGLLICHNKPKKDKFLMGKNELIILNDL
ncbi:MAG: GxxExxY protein, partial [archaeon]|nr:GxxExxY protein [archaeon]